MTDDERIARIQKTTKTQRAQGFVGYYDDNDDIAWLLDRVAQLSRWQAAVRAHAKKSRTT